MDRSRFYNDVSQKSLSATSRVVSAREYLQLVLSRRQLERVAGADYAVTDRITDEEFLALTTEIRKFA